MFPSGAEPAATLRHIGRAIVSWLRGQVLISFYMMLIYGVGFAFLKVPLWPLLAMICGSLHIVPMAGALLGVLIPVVAVLLAGGGGAQLLGVLLVFVATQAIETFLLTPHILGRELSLRPALVFIALMAGGLLFGFFGALFAAPAVAIAGIIWRAMSAGARR